MEEQTHKKDYFAPMHTAEHVLTGTIVKRYGCERAFTTHIEKKKSKIDFRLDVQPSPEDLADIERTVNEVLAQGLPVTEEFLHREEAMARFNLSRLPEDAGDTVRIVRVGDYDACPCIGEHVENTAGIPPVRIISADCTEGVLRVRFRFNKT